MRWIQNWIGLDSNLNLKVCESIHPWTSLEGRCDCGGGHGNVVACGGGIQAQAAEQTVAELASNLVMKMLKLHYMMMLWRYSFMMIQSCHVICRCWDLPSSRWGSWWRSWLSPGNGQRSLQTTGKDIYYLLLAVILPLIVQICIFLLIIGNKVGKSVKICFEKNLYFVSWLLYVFPIYLTIRF